MIGSDISGGTSQFLDGVLRFTVVRIETDIQFTTLGIRTGSSVIQQVLFVYMGVEILGHVVDGVTRDAVMLTHIWLHFRVEHPQLDVIDVLLENTLDMHGIRVVIVLQERIQEKQQEGVRVVLLVSIRGQDQQDVVIVQLVKVHLLDLVAVAHVHPAHIIQIMEDYVEDALDVELIIIAQVAVAQHLVVAPSAPV